MMDKGLTRLHLVTAHRSPPRRRVRPRTSERRVGRRLLARRCDLPKLLGVLSRVNVAKRWVKGKVFRMEGLLVYNAFQ